jgi:phosphoribosylformimino-5-aminoimidazole carboxamide ribotide isomerase
MFTLYPAIDLKEGKCVRLTQGEMDKATIYDSSPAEQAKAYQDAGFQYVHLVDLDGAFQGKPANEQAVRSVLANVTIPVQLGGGLRNMDVIAKWLEAGITRVILGTVAQKNPIFVKEACRLFPDQIVVGIDARNGQVATDGWAKQTSTQASDLALKFEDAGVAAIIYTDIHRDGVMAGPNIEETAALAEKLTIPVIASGGIRSADDVRAYAALQDIGIEGIVIGKALYEGTLTYKDALAAVA